MIKGIIFDFDGTILDTETASYRAWISLYERYGLAISMEEWGRFIGTKNKDDNPYTFIRNQVENFLRSEEDVRSEIKQMAASAMANEEILPGVLRLINYAKNQDMKLAIATSSARETLLSHLKKFNLESAFDVLSTSDDVQRVKPDPELYLRAIDALELAKDEVVAIEDSPNGAMAAKRAGIRCVVVPNPMTKILTFPEVDLMLESLEHFDIRLLNH